MEPAPCSSNTPSDFRSIPLLPRRSELLEHNHTLPKPNIIDGGYSSVDHYLDVQFRLLREDFLCGLREGIQSYLKNKSQEHHDNIRIFNNVKFLKLEDNLDRTGYLVQLQLKEIKNRKPDNDMFMFGSLLVFTCDHFKTMLISTVLNSENYLLNKGQIIVTIPLDRHSPSATNHFYKTSFIMIESEAYFEPYKYVMKALQHEDFAKNFPMKKYIIEAKPHTAKPSYIPRQFHESTICSNAKMNLNRSQRDAYVLALTEEFAIIQGPPGTGKTHIGLEVARAVLANGNKAKPMLVICFTNHALDTFLEGLLRITDRIVRIGGHSQNKKLENYNLSKLRRQHHVKMTKLTYERLIQPLKVAVVEMVFFEESLKKQRISENDEKVIFQRLLNRYKTYAREYKQYKLGKDLAILRNAAVIGMTTTGAARLQPLLRSLRAPVVIVEEAAEALEAHIIASLTEHCKHLILIGDHQQLQPTSASYILGQKYNLEVSLFERMIANGINSTTLNVQHRMRPEIAALIAPSIYDNLKNHPSVEHFPPVKGIKKNVYFVNHKVHEDKRTDNNLSHLNKHEAQFLIRLGIYLLQQGYEAEEITILTTYKRQLVLLEDLAFQHDILKKVLITTIDSYQGEENKIILLSLVRSNESDSIGFLARENRVCVALSRAREGFYMIGNMDGLRKKSNLWRQIGITLEKQEAVSPELPLMCHYHPNIVTKVSQGEDFDKIPDGLCLQHCHMGLECGHTCNLVCHENDREHIKIKCETCK